MKNNTSPKTLPLLILLLLIFQMGCKKSSPDSNISTNQGKLLFNYIHASLIDTANGIYTMNKDGSSKQKINIILPTNVKFESQFVAKLSPDKKIIFFSASDGCIYSCNIDGSNLKKITNSEINTSQVIGDTYYVQQQGKILYLKYQNDGSSELWTMNFDGSNAQKVNITLPQSIMVFSSQPKASPDGSAFFFSTYQNQSFNIPIYSCNADGSNTKFVLDGAAGSIFKFGGIYTIQQQPKILYEQLRGVEQYLGTVNLDGTNAQNINVTLPLHSSFYGNPPVLSNDGKSIFFNLDDYGVYSCNTDGSNLKSIFTGDYNNRMLVDDSF
jgi:Tol biopolymer transport system component